jgi:DOPA 4,5-dioxygenase
LNNRAKIVAIHAHGWPVQAVPVISDYHFHLYFDEATRASAADIRARLERQAAFPVEAGPLRDGPVGPHPLAQFRATVPAGALEAALSWYMRHHGVHTVLVHPNSGDDLLDHTAHALWLGAAVVLDASRL